MHIDIKGTFMIFLKKSRLFLAMLLLLTNVEQTSAGTPQKIAMYGLPALCVVGLIYAAAKRKSTAAVARVSNEKLYQFEENKSALVKLAAMTQEEREAHIAKLTSSMTRDELIIFYGEVLADRAELRALVEKNAIPNRLETLVAYLKCVDEVVLQTFNLCYKGWYEKIAEDSYFSTDNHITWKIAARFPQARDGETRVYQMLSWYRESLQNIIAFLRTKPVHPDREQTLNGSELLLKRIEIDLEILSKNPRLIVELQAKRQQAEKDLTSYGFANTPNQKEKPQAPAKPDVTRPGNATNPHGPTQLSPAVRVAQAIGVICYCCFLGIVFYRIATI